MSSSTSSDFYLRYYVGHKGKFGHEFLEFEFRPDGEFTDNNCLQMLLTCCPCKYTIYGIYLCT